MNQERMRLFILILFLSIIAIGCQKADVLIAEQQTEESSPTSTAVKTPTPTPTSLPDNPIEPGEINFDEPAFITGDIPYTSPFFLNSISEPYVLLEDQAGFILRDRKHLFSHESQVLGAVQIDEDLNLTYGLSLPSIPQGQFFDLDNDSEDDIGVQVFAVAYWSNTWGDPFLEERDGTGWSTAYASTITDPENDDEIIGGQLVIWSPDENQSFPIDFGEDGLLFTDDDPSEPVAAGYSLVDLNQSPFRIYKEERPELTLIEGDIAVNDYSSLSYSEAFSELFDKASREYPFTDEKGINWEDLYDKYSQILAKVNNPNDFYRALRDFTYEISDGHVGVSLNQDVFFEERGGSFGLILTELSDGNVIVTESIPGLPGSNAGIEVGAIVHSWNGQPILEAIQDIEPYFGPYSTEHTKRINQLYFLTRVPSNTRVEIEFQNPGDVNRQQKTLTAVIEIETLLLTIPSFNNDELVLPIEGEVLDDSGIGYIRVITFDDDYHLMAQLWERYIQALIDNEIPGLVIDLRANGGGSGGLAYDFAGYFFDEEITVSESYYFNENSRDFEYSDYPAKISPAPLFYEGKIAVLVSPDCVSACEGFAHALSQNERAIIVGHYPSAGAYGEVGRGQYKLPDEITMQFPTGRSETPDGELIIEGVGIIPDIIVPVTADSALGIIDAVLETAVSELLRMIY